MTDNVVLLRNGSPALTDIPGHLRKMADEIEAGEHGDVTAAIMLLPVVDDFPLAFGCGDVEGQNQPIVQLELAKAWFVNHLVFRD